MEIKADCLLKHYTTLHTGGVADYLVEVESLQELRLALTFAKEHTDTPPLILGGGSNVLVGDEGYRGLVIVMRIQGRTYQDSEMSGGCQVTCGAGEVLDEVIHETCGKGLWGLENLSAIPGTVGATPVQNVGAYGVEVSSCITEVHTIHCETGEEKIFSREACQFSYRDSFFKTEEGKQWIIIAVTFLLSKEKNPCVSYADLASMQTHGELTPTLIRERVCAIRKEKFPDWSVLGTAGSFFKNPIIGHTHFLELQEKYPNIVGYKQDTDTVKVSLGWILDKVCGLKGYRAGKVALYEKQALVLVAERGVSANEIEQFSAYIKQVVHTHTGIHIENEVQRI